MFVIGRIGYILIGLMVGAGYVSYQAHKGMDAIEYSNEILVFNASKLACLQGGADWDTCWKISNKIYDDLPKGWSK